MTIIEYKTTPTHKSLMNKTKWDLASLVMRLINDYAILEKRACRLKEELKVYEDGDKMKIKVWSVEMMHKPCYYRLSDTQGVLDIVSTYLEEEETCQLTISQMSMTEEQFKALPDFDGY